MVVKYPMGIVTKFLYFKDEDGVAPNSRGYSSVFGPDVTRQFLSRNGLKYIIRSHECVQYGFDMCHDDTVNIKFIYFYTYQVF